MQRVIFFTLFFGMCCSSLAQFQDNFDDNSFPNDPSWFGNTEIYVVNAVNELQLMDTAGGTSSIYTPLNTADSTTWEFYVRLEFDPSSTNRLRIFLGANTPDFAGNLQGYFLEIGDTGSDDALELWRKDGASNTLLLAGALGGVAVEPTLRIRVTRDNAANWELWTDYTGGTNFTSEGIVADATYPTGNYFGFQCNYSTTRKDKFYFDDVFIGPIVADVTPPDLLAVAPQNETNVQLTFNESLDEATAENPANYSINNGVTVQSAELGTNPSEVTLTLSPMVSGTTYTLNVSDVEDQSGNAIGNVSSGFTYYQLEAAEPFDLLINEVFPSPDSMQTSMPHAEFFELYNQSDKAIDLTGFEIADRSNTKTLSTFVFPPQSYLIICDAADAALFETFGTVLAVPSLFALNDSDDDLSISDSDGTLIHSISYTNAWYRDTEKDGGGWTIEQINPNLYCRVEENWRASEAIAGGTPGQENSIFENTMDLVAPSLIDAIPLNNAQLALSFSEVMGASAENLGAYVISDLGTIGGAELEAAGKNVLLTLNAPFFADGVTYTITVEATVGDCSGNGIGAENSFTFTYYDTQEAEKYDILINEIFPDPAPALGLPEQEFVELYNRSDKVFNLQDFVLEGNDKEIVLPFHLFLPGDYVILYKGGGESFSPFGDTLVLDDFVSLTNESGELTLKNPGGQIVDAIRYDLTWYQDFSKASGGWTLERINPNAPCTFANNWQASLNTSGGTPGRENSGFAPADDQQGPDLLRLFPASENSLLLSFDKSLDLTAVLNTANYEIEGLEVIAALPIAPLYNDVLLFFDPEIVEGEIYEIKIKAGLTDCLGNPIGLFDSGRFALPQTIEPGDLVINELLYDPASGGVRFLELYNTSSKVLNVNDLVLARRNPETGAIEKTEAVEYSALSFPGEYIVLTSFPTDIKERYLVENERALIPARVPAYDSREDIVLVMVPGPFSSAIIDEFPYDSDYHNALLEDTDGVSLERISPIALTDDKANWHSAAKSVGYATPTAQNSQFFATQDGSATDPFTLTNSTFSPDGDGYKDFLWINYETESVGQVANIQIFDARGRLVKELVQNELLANEGQFKWDGDTENGTKGRIGIYILWIELFKENGEREYLKKSCVLAGKLD